MYCRHSAKGHHCHRARYCLFYLRLSTKRSKRLYIFICENGKCFSIIQQAGIIIAWPPLVPNHNFPVLSSIIELIIIGKVLLCCKISKRFSIVTAYSSFGAEPNIAGFIFINTQNPVIGKPLLGCEMLKGFSIVIINT